MPALADAQLHNLALDQLAPDPEQPRTEFSAEGLKSLAASLAAHGLIEPLVAIRNPDLEERRHHPYRILVGERRWRAARIAGIESVPVLVRKEPPDPAERLLLQIEENDEREELSLLDRARAVARGLEVSRLTKKDFAQKINKSLPWLSSQLNVAAATGLPLQALEHRLIRRAEALRLFSKLDSSDQRRLISQAVRLKTTISPSQVQRLLDRQGGSEGTNGTALEGTGEPAAAPPEPPVLVPLGEISLDAFKVLLASLGADLKQLPAFVPDHLPHLLDAFRAQLAERLAAS